MDNVEIVIEKALQSSTFVLVSYYFLPLKAVEDDSAYLSSVHTRIQNGVRNHYTNKEIVDLLSSKGIISGIDVWQTPTTTQTLFLLRNRDWP